MTNRSTARTAITDISYSQVLLNPTEQGVQVVMGTLTADLPPGSVVFFVKATNSWTAADADTAGNLLVELGVVGYNKRVNQTTGAVKIITDNWDTSEVEDKRVPIILSGICIARIDDLGAGGGPLLSGLTVSANAGIFKLWASATGCLLQATIADTVIDDDVWAIVGLGKFKGAIWGSS